MGTQSAPRVSARSVRGSGQGSEGYPALCSVRRGRNFKPRGPGATLPPAIRAARPTRWGAGEGRGAKQMPQRSPIPPRQRESRRVPAGSGGPAAVRATGMRRQPSPGPGTVYRGAPPRSHGGHGANADLARVPGRGRADNTEDGGGGWGGARRARGTTPPPAARSVQPTAPPAPPRALCPAGARPAGGGAGARRGSGRWRLHGGTRRVEGCEGLVPPLAGGAAPQHPWATGTALPRT